jgi:hypothetical protein
MKAFAKTLFGDAYNVAAVACVVAVGALAAGVRHPEWAVFAMPLAALAAVAWLVRH